MAQTVESTTLSAVGQWFENLFNQIYYQPDNDVAVRAFEENIAPDFTARLNQDDYTRTKFLEMVKESRNEFDMSLESNREVISISCPPELGVASEEATAWCTGQLSTFTCVKKDGSKMIVNSLMVGDVKLVDGKRVLVRLREVADD